MTTVDAAAAFRRASYGLYGIATINLVGGMILLSMDGAHQLTLVGSLAFLDALVKLALAYYVWRGSHVATITAMVVLGLSAMLDVATLLSGSIGALTRLALVALVLWWLRRALQAARRPEFDGEGARP